MEEEKSKNQEETAKSDAVTKKKTSFWKIDKKTLPYKMNFFLYIGAMGSLLPFHPSIGITRLGLGASNLAVVFTVQQFLFIVLKPLIGYIVDYFNNLKAMIVILTLLNGLLSYLLLVIPPVENPNIANWNESQYNAIKFCNLCDNFNDLQEVAVDIPEDVDVFEKELVCENGSSTMNYRMFINNCSKTTSSSSSSLNDKLEIFIKSCNISPSTLNLQKEDNAFNDLVKSLDNVKLFIKMTIKQNSTGYIVTCPNISRISDIENITVDFISKSCYATPSSEIETSNTFESFDNVGSNISCNEPNSKNIKSTKILESYYFKTYQFWLFTIFIWIACTCTSCIFTLSDTACYESLLETGGDYGKQRAWGSVSWGLMAPLAGFLNDYTDSYFAAMVLMTILCALQLWNLSTMNLKKPQISQNFLKDIKNIFQSMEFLAFELAVFMNGMGIGIVWFYLAWFITDIGGSRLLIGLAHTVQCFLGEMPFMIISGWMLKKIGHFNVVSLALFSHFIRFVGYSYLTNPWYILPLECLDGITFGAFYTAMTSYGKLSAKPGTEATTQSLLCSTYEGLGAGLGCVISGVCFDHFGGHTTFFYAGLCCAAATAINVCSTLLLRCRKKVLVVSKKDTCDDTRY